MRLLCTLERWCGAMPAIDDWLCSDGLAEVGSVALVAVGDVAGLPTDGGDVDGLAVASFAAEAAAAAADAAGALAVWAAALFWLLAPFGLPGSGGGESRIVGIARPGAAPPFSRCASAALGGARASAARPADPASPTAPSAASMAAISSVSNAGAVCSGESSSSSSW